MIKKNVDLEKLKKRIQELKLEAGILPREQRDK